MATSEPLVPKGLPQGERQAQVQARQFANLPLAPPNPGQRLFDSLAGASGQQPGIRNVAPNLDLLQMMPPPAAAPGTPAPAPAPSLRGEMERIAATSLNPFLRAVALDAASKF